MEQLQMLFAKKMARKILYEALFTVAAFCITYFVLLQVDWMTLLNVEKVSKSTEKEIRRALLGVFQANGS
jgi:hypothetical protein